ncbi:centromere protein H [Anas platyrhynchos]|uniref:centromere protein H n=1 Tax=Anas platyrhynchos TaxID=8839 RepID=UPI0018D688EF|nr:centromere protein H [Anas platyrhynchos]
MAEPGGAGPEPNAEPEPEPEPEPEVTVNIPFLIRLREQLKQQLMECQTAAQACQGGCPDHDVEEKATTESMQNLENELEKIKTSFKNKTLFVQRMQFADALRKKMAENDGEARLIVDTLLNTVELSRAIIEFQKETRDIEDKVNAIRRKRLILRQAEEDKLQKIHLMMQKIKELGSKEVNEMLEKIRKNLQTERAMTTVIQNVFQSIIIGSQVNWAEDPSLKAIVLQLEKNVSESER